MVIPWEIVQEKIKEGQRRIEMETIRIRLTKEQKEQLQKIADNNHRSITGTIRMWIESYGSRPPQANELFSNKYIEKV